MPSSHGGGHSGGGGHHGSGGFRSSGSKNSGPKFSRTKPFPGARRYYYINTMGVRRSFYYGGVPQKRSLVSVIFPPLIFIIAGIVMATVMFAVIIPTKLKPSKCVFSGAFVSDADDLFTSEEEDAMIDSFKAFYDKTGIEPYLYAFESHNLPAEYGTEINRKSMESYAYNIYVNTFSDEGHFMILYTETLDSSGNVQSWFWVDMAGNDTGNLIDDDAFDYFQDVMQRYLNASSISKGEAIARSFDESAKSIMKLPIFQIIYLSVFFLFFIGLPLFACISNAKDMKEMNEYCDYRDKNGGVDFTEPIPGMTSTSSVDTKSTDAVSSSEDDKTSTDGSDLFD